MSACFLLGIQEHDEPEVMDLVEFLVTAQMSAELAVDMAAARTISPEIAHMYTQAFVAATELLGRLAQELDCAVDRLSSPAEKPDTAGH